MFFPTVAEVWMTVFQNGPYLCLSTGFALWNSSTRENAHSLQFHMSSSVVFKKKYINGIDCKTLVASDVQISFGITPIFLNIVAAISPTEGNIMGAEENPSAKRWVFQSNCSALFSHYNMLIMRCSFWNDKAFCRCIKLTVPSFEFGIITQKHNNVND